MLCYVRLRKETMEFSEQILYIRSKNNLSQMALAKELHVSYATISRWKNSKSNPTKKELLSFKKYCKQELIDFKEIEDER